MTAFLLVASCCALIEALTTIVTEWIYRHIPHADTFEKQIEIANNPYELAFCRTVLIEMFFILVAYVGIVFLAWQVSTILAILGLIFFTLFIFLEVSYRSVELFAVKRVWIPAYQKQPDEARKLLISSFNDIVEALYFPLLVGNLLGSTLLGVALLLVGGWAILGSAALLLNGCRLLLRLLEMHVGWRKLAQLNSNLYGPLSISIALALAVSLALESHVFLQ